MTSDSGDNDEDNQVILRIKLYQKILDAKWAITAQIVRNSVFSLLLKTTESVPKQKT